MGSCTELSKFSKKNVLLKKPLVAKIWRIFQFFFLHISSQNMFLNKCSTPKGQLNYNLCLLEEGKVEKLAENSVCKEQLDLTTKFWKNPQGFSMPYQIWDLGQLIGKSYQIMGKILVAPKYWSFTVLSFVFSTWCWM